MPQQTINLGSAPDDGTGDTLRVGGDKINDNFTELYTDKADKAGGTFTGDISVPDEAYDATAWNGSLEVPTKNAVRDKIESLGSGITELDDIPDVNAPTPSNGDVLTWDSTPGEWVPAAPTGGSNALDDLTDVDAPTPADGDVLTFDSGSGDWVPAAPSGGGWTSLHSYDFASGAASTREVDVTGYAEIEIACVGLVHAASVFRSVQVSIDGGSNWYTTSGNYQEISTLGAGTNAEALLLHGTATTAARTCYAAIKDNDARNPVTVHLLTRGIQGTFNGSSTAINRIRLVGINGAGGVNAGNFTAGTLKVRGRN